MALTEVDLSNEIVGVYLSYSQSSPGAVLGQKVGALWLRRGLVVALRWVSERFRKVWGGLGGPTLHGWPRISGPESSKFVV